MKDLNYLNKIWKRGTDFLGVKYSILCGAMSWVSESNLVAAVSNSGGFGIIAAANMPGDILAAEIDKTFKKTKYNFGVNIITVTPYLKDQLDVALQKEVTHIFFGGGIPNGKDIQRVKEAGSKVICFAPTISLAKRMIRHGVDALIIEGNEAGGHIGPISTSLLVQEIILNIKEVPVFVAGGIATGEIIAHYLTLGAAGCQLGTRFVAAEECIAHDKFKQVFLKAKSRDAVVTAQFDPILPVIPVRAIVNEGTRDYNELQLKYLQEVKAKKIKPTEAQLKLEEFWLGSLRRAVIEGDVEKGSLMAGQSVGMVKSVQPTAEIMEELVTSAENKLKAMYNGQ
ncbi:MAG: nitronate monooxygenase family protein [Nitrospinota bacterium]|jgi:enoyl-[acyl-carrier protein] reductase II|nr:nitronate monooxygenase family protein [Nitrospinota bacterium]HJN02296.1 nitronate monooxygenase family protein [Nitrospinota bacterium]